MPKGLDYLINIKDGDFSGVRKGKAEVLGLDDAVDRTGRGLKNFGAIAAGAGAIIGGALAIDRMIDFGAASKVAFMAGEKAAAQANQAIITTGGLAGQSLDALKAKADMWEGKTLFGNEDILGADSLLLTFTNIRGEIYDKAMPAVLDMAQRMAGDGPADLKGASLQLGKALNDPIAGINALRRVGVSFSDQQKEMIATAVKHGDVQKAQAIILKEVNTEFGGSAEAARKVLGASGELDYQIGELKEGLGALIKDGTDPVSAAMVTVVSGLKDGVQWISENKDLVKTLAAELGIAAGVYITASAGMSIYAAYQAASAAATGGMTVAQWALNAAMTANPVGLIVGGIALLVGGLTIAYKKSETFRAILSGIGDVASSMIPIFVGLGKTIIGALTVNPKLIKEGFQQQVDGISSLVKKGGISGAFNEGFDKSMAESKKAALSKGSSASDLVKPAANKTPYSISGGKSKKGSGDDSTSLAGGRSVRNVQIQFKNLVETLEVHTTNIQGGTADIKRQLTELLVGVVHDSELGLGTQ